MKIKKRRNHSQDQADVELQPELIQSQWLLESEKYL